MARRIVPSPPAPPAKKTRRRPLRPEDRSIWTGRLLLYLESPDPRLLDKEAGKLYHRIHESGARMQGPVPLPVDERPSGPERPALQRIHRRLFHILSPGEETAGLLEKLSLSQTVESSILVEETEPEDASPATRTGES